MAALKNMSLAHFLILIAVLTTASEIIILSDPNLTWMNWKVIANTGLLVGVLTAGIVKFITYRKSKKAGRSA